MALYWPEARLAVECAEVRGHTAEKTPGVLVITMRPEQADDPEFAEAVRSLIMARTLERERDVLEGLSGWREDQGTRHGSGNETEDDEDRLADAEKRFEERLMDAETGPEGTTGDDAGARDSDSEGMPEDDPLAGWREPLSESLWSSEPLVQVVVGHCDEVVVGS